MDDLYTFDTVEDGYVIYRNDKMMRAWEVEELLNNHISDKYGNFSLVHFLMGYLFAKTGKHWKVRFEYGNHSTILECQHEGTSYQSMDLTGYSSDNKDENPLSLFEKNIVSFLDSIENLTR